MRGFTLIEMVVTLVLLGILATVGSKMVADNMRTMRVVDSNQATSNQARYVLERLTREIREVKYNKLAANYAITSTLSAGAASITFTRTINGTDTTVTIACASNAACSNTNQTLNLTYVAGGVTTTSPIASNATAFSLKFYDLDSLATTSASTVRSVEMTVTLKDGLNGQATTERMRVALRNS